MYYQLGVCLNLPSHELNEIRTQSPHNVAQAFSDMMLKWLKQCYNVTKFGPPTWRMLVKAVGSEAGGNNKALAKKIASKHILGELILVISHFFIES